jgi:hypothetical protein
MDRQRVNNNCTRSLVMIITRICYFLFLDYYSTTVLIGEVLEYSSSLKSLKCGLTWISVCKLQYCIKSTADWMIILCVVWHQWDKRSSIPGASTGDERRKPPGWSARAHPAWDGTEKTWLELFVTSTTVQYEYWVFFTIIFFSQFSLYYFYTQPLRK